MASKSDLEANGWRQGAIAHQAHIPELLNGLRDSIPDDAELVVISQSCDLAQSEDVEPVVEVVLARRLKKLDGNFTFNKNPRCLDISVRVATGSDDVAEEVHLRLAAADKIAVPKKRFYGKYPDAEKLIQYSQLATLVSWLAARYARSALPTAFNSALDGSDPGARKRRQLAKRVSVHTSGIYVEITPNRDLAEGERYSVNLLGLIQPSAVQHRGRVEREIQQLSEVLKCAGMDVYWAVRTEAEVSISTIRQYQRLQYDDLSLRGSDPPPVKP